MGGCRSQEVAHRDNSAVGVESLVFSPGEAHKPLGGADRRIKPLFEGDRNDAVELAVQYQGRHRDRADPRIRAELVLHQKTDWDQRIAQLGDLGGGSERRFQDQPSDRVFARQRHRDAGTERFSPHHYSLGGVTIRIERIPRGGVEQKSRLARRSSRAAKTAVGDGNDAEPALHELSEAVTAVAQRSAVPLKIENDRPIGLRRNVPGD